MPPFLADPIVIIICGVILVVGGIIWLRLHPFLALLLGAFAVAMMTPAAAIEQFAIDRGMSAQAAAQMADRHVGERIAEAFGKTVGTIGILIAMASIIGKCLLDSGSAEKIVRSLLRLTGPKNAPAAFFGGSFFLGIPVFFDTVFYLMVPLAKAMAARLGKNYILLIMAITGGAAMSNSLVPPTPGPLFLVSEMKIPIGMMMIGGTIVGLFTIAAGYGYAVWANRRWPIPLRDSIDAPLEKIHALAAQDESRLPNLWLALLPVLIPLVFISASATIDSYYADANHPLLTLIRFLGEKNTALTSGALAALLILAFRNRGSGSSTNILEPVSASLMSAGVIILITAAGGAFGGMLQQTGISTRIADLTSGYQMALIPLSFFITAIVRTAQGSATVAMITAAGILAGVATDANLDYHPLYLALSIACGSKLIPWMNDSGFWIVGKMSNLTESEVLKTFSPLLTIMGLAGLLVIMIGAKLFPLI
ncbi:GntP family permease [Phragmitibacter flavus]|uniref:GntP family permease n=1 Tax=Phragmitibacter flavus TaxID=2576071 RepID=A0A5R8KC20_9BACT|nr:SLC13 family permease [Phragmitibacter flavus]TLD69485.1 GntP family permease [Phragmitibacter flavus]